MTDSELSEKLLKPHLLANKEYQVLFGLWHKVWNGNTLGYLGSKTKRRIRKPLFYRMDLKIANRMIMTCAINYILDADIDCTPHQVTDHSNPF